MKTTLNKIRAHGPCRDGWEKLLRHLGKTEADDEPLSIETILDSNGLADALWCLQAVKGRDREIRLYAIWCARRVQNLMSDPRSVAALDVAERHARGSATDEELVAAARAALAAEAGAWWAAKTATTRRAAAAARLTASWGTAAGPDEKSAQAEELRRICREIEAGRDPYTEEEGR